MKEDLLQMGWKCLPCNCPGNPDGLDCSHPLHRGYVIKTVGQNYFKLFKNELLIENGQSYELAEVLAMRGIKSPALKRQAQ